MLDLVAVCADRGSVVGRRPGSTRSTLQPEQRPRVRIARSTQVRQVGPSGQTSANQPWRPHRAQARLCQRPICSSVITARRPGSGQAAAAAWPRFLPTGRAGSDLADPVVLRAGGDQVGPGADEDVAKRG